MAEPGPVVVAVDEQDLDLDVERWAALAEAALRDERVTEGELNLLFVDESRMARLNSEHMGESMPTDVLSFPLDGAEADTVTPTLVGDVVVCPEYAAAQAAENTGPLHRGTIEDELALLVVHGVLHVLGYDHADPDDADRMQARERELLTQHYRS